jgi:hypothetical protein
MEEADLPNHIETAYREPQPHVDYRANPSAGGESIEQDCPSYDKPYPRPEAPAAPQTNLQNGPGMIYTPLDTGVSLDSAAAIAFERAQSGAPKPYPEEPGYLQINDPRGMS